MDVGAVRARLLAAVRRRCPAWLAADSEDIVQEAMVRVLEIAERSGGFDRFGQSYLERVAQNAVIDAVRARFRRQETTLYPGDDPLREPEDKRAGGAEIGLHVERGLRACLALLIRPRRLAVACRLLGHSVAEAAALTGWTTKKIEHLTARGLDDLRDCLRGKGIEP